MKIDTLISKMKQHGVSMPKTGTGRNGRILAEDLVNALGDHFLSLSYKTESHKQHLFMRRQLAPMKSYRFNKLSVGLQNELFENDNDWVFEEKFNGWRLILTYIPESGFRVWGGNTSDVDFLPVEYTNNVLLNGLHPIDKSYHHIYTIPLAFDTEGVVNDSVEMLDGRFSSNTLEGVKAILGCDPIRSIELQCDATVVFKVFDAIQYDAQDLSPMLHIPYMHRLRDMHYFVSNAKCFGLTQLEAVKQIDVHKNEVLKSIWRNGGEGVIAKNLKQPYVPGSRKKEISVKIKRSMSGEVGDDIDAFIIGYINTPEWLKRGLVGGLLLGVYTMDGEQRHIATVTSMPDSVREQLTDIYGDQPGLNTEYMDKVLIVDGQELSSRNQKIMHAVVDWDKGFREDKSPSDCVLDIGSVDNEVF